MLTGIEIENINHLGIIAGIIDELNIVDIINQELGIEEQEIVNSGEIVKAIILNGLGFVSQPLYLFPKFFEDKATSHLLGAGILPEHLNEHKIGRVMDKLYSFGLSELFLLIALAAAKKYQINLDFSHKEFQFFCSSWSIQSSSSFTIRVSVTRVRGGTNPYYDNSWLFERASTPL